MKSTKLIYLVLSILIFSAFFMSCHEDQSEILSKESSTLKSRSSLVNLNLPFYANSYEENNLRTESGEFRFTKDGNEYITEIIVTYDDSNENLIKISISDNFLIVLDVDITEIENAIIEEVNSDKEGGPRLSEHAACIEWCKKNYTDADGNKIEGRGACKANCWVDTAIRVLEALSPL